MTRRRFDFSLLAIAVLLTVQATLATYGIRLVRDVAAETHHGLVVAARSVGR